MNEQDNLQDIIKKVREASLKAQKEKGPKLRQLHSKSHGLVQASLIVEENLSEDYQVGVFAAPGHEYEAWVRFSNASAPERRGVLQADTVGDARGFAIKVNSVEGDFVPSDEQGTQDFVFINHPIFFLPDVQGYIDMAQLRGLKQKQEAGETLSADEIQALQALAQKLAPSLAIGEEIRQKKVGNPLNIGYWSTTPSRFDNRFIKFSVRPHNLETPPCQLPDSPNYLREAMISHLTEAGQSSSFDFLIQFYVDEDMTPIENPMKEWKVRWEKVATLTIPPQEFDSDERKQFDESLSFNPWHTLQVHEPAGSINLARRSIYEAGTQARREAATAE